VRIGSALARGALVTGALTVGIGRVQAQDPRLVGRLDSVAARAVQAQVDSARLEGLPTEPLIDLALEGASKGATGTRILVAVTRTRGQLAQARAALGPSSTAEEIVSGAYALRLGATTNGLRKIREQRPGRDLGVPLATLLDLMARGVTPDTAQAVLLELTGADADDAKYGRLLRELDRALQKGDRDTPSGTTVRIGRTLIGEP
jgi:hypothetical protein